jgi:hypothetical protein
MTPPSGPATPRARGLGGDMPVTSTRPDLDLLGGTKVTGTNLAVAESRRGLCRV